jgi:hypothetical protein
MPLQFSPVVKVHYYYESVEELEGKHRAHRQWKKRYARFKRVLNDLNGKS